MSFDVIERNLISNEDWDNFCLVSSGNLNHLSHYQEYLKITYDLIDFSFGITSGGELVAVAPILLSRERTLMVGSNSELSAIPIQRPLLLNSNNKLLIDLLLLEISHRVPANSFFEFDIWGTDQLADQSSVGLESYFTKTSHRQTLLVNLSSREEEHFKRISRGHQRTIKKSRAAGQIVTILSSSSRKADVVAGFQDYRDAHANAAGRITRSNQSFELMLEFINSGQACLFIGRSGHRDLSFLYCDFRAHLSRGWSQANSSQLLPGEFPRHQTEWEAFNYFRRVGVKYYHLGAKFEHNNDSEISKIHSINDYKDRFHPICVQGFTAILKELKLD